MSDGIQNASGAATAPPLKTVLMTPSSQTRGVRFDVDVVNLDDIPGAMDHMVSVRLIAQPTSWIGARN